MVLNKMNKKGQVTIFVSLMIGVVLFLLGMALASPMRQVVSDARAEGTGNSTGLNCTTVTGYQDKANCVAVDIMLPLLVGVILGFAGFVLSRSFL